jgi:GNAT superfamily N-acetyltransferase
MCRICEVDGFDDDVADALWDLHRLTFFDNAPMPEFDIGRWWLVFCDDGMPLAFAGLAPSTHVRNAGYFCRVGVLPDHRGSSLQVRLMRRMEYCTRRNGWRCVVSDTTDNMASANNFIRAGYRLFRPDCPWGWTNTLYWRKHIVPNVDCRLR